MLLIWSEQSTIVGLIAFQHSDWLTARVLSLNKRLVGISVSGSLPCPVFFRLFNPKPQVCKSALSHGSLLEPDTESPSLSHSLIPWLASAYYSDKTPSVEWDFHDSLNILLESG